MFDGLTREALAVRERELAKRFEAQRDAGLALDLTRGKPGPEQVALSDGLDDVLGGDYRLDDGSDVRNYGGLTGIPEARRMGAELLGLNPEEVIAGGNSSLTLMYEYVLNAWLNGPLGPETAWRREPGPLKFLCVVPGYDRHFRITESLGFELVNVRIGNGGPDMDRIEALVAADPAIKGVWCVPKYSNPTGHVYSDEVVERFAHLARRSGPNFRILWDNAYAVHDLDDAPPVLANVMDRCRAAGTEDSVVLFASTSKITRAGAGVSFLGASPANLAAFAKHLAVQTIGPDKVNQLRHVRFLRDAGGIRALMRRHAAIVRPKFDLVRRHLEEGLGAEGLGSWTNPRGGYFLSFETPPGLASRVVALAAEAGVKLTPAGATFPYGRDPDDTNIRIAPTYPALEEIDQAMPVFVGAVALAAARRRLETGSVSA
ncbi:MAG: aminotransferase class I/II-fold pyridoxal phosphate-dependent enzyme [Acidobacteria bacterium]|nr:aminotransferase class I/II-fold pyridoxal phosphate-dependent enzyme [Acidobacteriota bacterium]